VRPLHRRMRPLGSLMPMQFPYTAGIQRMFTPAAFLEIPSSRVVTCRGQDPSSSEAGAHSYIAAGMPRVPPRTKYFELAKAASSPFMRAYYQRVAERYLSAHGELRPPLAPRLSGQPG
jgi:hypothetical protein